MRSLTISLVHKRCGFCASAPMPTVVLALFRQFAMLLSKLGLPSEISMTNARKGSFIASAGDFSMLQVLSTSLLLLNLFCATAPAVARPFAPPEPEELFIADSVLLKNLEQAGASFGAIFGAAYASRDNGDLLVAPGYQDLLRVLDVDLNAEAQLLQSSPVIQQSDVTLFNPRWLKEHGARFDLVAVVNRFDQILSSPDTCGDLRFVYRLRYSYKAQWLNLPFFASTLFPLARGGRTCAEIAAASLFPGGGAEEKLAALMRPGGIYRPFLSGSVKPDRLEVNFQISFWPHVIPAGLADEGHYLLRSFAATGAEGRWRIMKLINTPDVAKVFSNPDQKAAFLRWLRLPANLAGLDRGTLQIPETFLAERAVSVSPFGMARESNRLFGARLRGEDFNDLDLKKFKKISSPKALIRRLDSLTCVGCHQSDSIAGFHMFGAPLEHDDFPFVEDVLFSPYFEKSIDFRRGLIAAYRRRPAGLAAMSLPSTERNFAESDLDAEGGVGSACGTGDAGFAAWTCNRGFVCSADFPSGKFTEIGRCIKLTSDAATVPLGEPCDRSVLSEGPGPHFGQLQNSQILGCQDFSGNKGICAATAFGFPLGQCTARCKSATATLACIATPELGPFSTCFNRTHSFKECLRLHNLPSIFPRCHFGRDCHDDYICAKAPSDDRICVPTYFLPSFSIHGHVAPTDG